MKMDVCVLITLIAGEVLGCRDCNKVVCDLVQHYKATEYASLVQGTPV